MGSFFVDDTRRFPFFFNGYFDICGDKNKGFAFARLKRQINLMGCNRRPATGYGIGELAFFNSFVDKGLLDRLHNILDNEFGRVTYTEAVELLKKSGHTFEYPVEWGIDLQTEHERYLTEQIYKKPVFVTDYPVEIKAFYMRLNDDKKTVAAMDLLVPGVGEIIGGSQREERLEVLENRMNELGLKKEDYWWYLDLRKYGGTRHAGFGLGFERAVMYLTGVGNIRDVLPYPRTVNNAEF